MNNLFLEPEMESLFTETIKFKIPERTRETFVKYMPYIIIALVLISAFALIFSTIAIFVSMFFESSILWILSFLASIAAIVYKVKSYNPLKGLKRLGWQALYTSFLLGIAANLLLANFSGALIGFLLEGYFLFQMREYYLPDPEGNNNSTT